MSTKQMFQLTLAIIIIALILNCNIPLKKQHQQNNILDYMFF